MKPLWFIDLDKKEIVDSENVEVCSVNFSDFDECPDRILADMHLIASAPIMYEACRIALDALEQMLSFETPTGLARMAVLKLKTAILSADGIKNG